jgi:uncharacterized RDD family membrane protein YckC
MGGTGVSQWGTLASWGERVIAYLIDLVIVAVPAIVLLIITFIALSIATILGVLFYLVFFAYVLVASFYIVGWQNGLGGSPGKRITGLRVIGEETGQPIGGGLGIVRSIAHVVDQVICYIGYLFPLWDPKRQTIADKIMKTLVTSGSPKVDFQTALKDLIPKQG